MQSTCKYCHLLVGLLNCCFRVLRAKTLRECLDTRSLKQTAILRQRLAMVGRAVMELPGLTDEEGNTVRLETSASWLSACAAWNNGGFFENLEIALGEFYAMNIGSEQQTTEARLYKLRLELQKGDALGIVLAEAVRLFDLAKSKSWKRAKDVAAHLVHAARIVDERNSS